jgi:hypothetical protein
MTGKIFPESTNLYEDQARILFNFYERMADRIVAEEERLEQEISSFEIEKQNLEKELSKTTILKWVLAILIIPFFIFLSKENQLKKQIQLLVEKIEDSRKKHDEIFRDYKVSKMGVVYVPTADQIRYEDKSFMVDYSGSVQETEVKLQLPKQNDLLIETISRMESLSKEAPIVETSDNIEVIETDHYSTSIQELNQHDYFGDLDRSLRTISFCIDDIDTISVSLPLVSSDEKYYGFLNEYATSELPEGAKTMEVFDTNLYRDEIAKFQELNRMKDSLSRQTSQFEDVLKELMQTMASAVQAISSLKIASTNKIVMESNRTLYQILKAPYNHYSPVIEASEIERIKNESFNFSESIHEYTPFQLRPSSRVRLNLSAELWTAEDGSTTHFPFGVHQIHEEIVAPIIQNLMRENRVERLKIYNHIKDQKISYLNKWHQDTMDFYGRNRSESADLINLMRGSLRDYVAAYNTLTSLKRTEESMAQSKGSLDAAVVSSERNAAEIFAAFELQSKEFQQVQQEFENYMERLKDDIDVRANKFEHIDYYDALLRDGNFREVAIATAELHDLDARRKPLISVNPLLAKTSEIPPVPSKESLLDEHLSINLPALAKFSLSELNSVSIPDVNVVSNDESLTVQSVATLNDISVIKEDSLNDGNEATTSESINDLTTENSDQKRPLENEDFDGDFGEEFENEDLGEDDGTIVDGDVDDDGHENENEDEPSWEDDEFEDEEDEDDDTKK